MNTATKLRIEIDDQISRRPDLLAAVNTASSYLEERVRKADISGLDDLSLGWEYRPEDTGWIEVSLALWDISGGLRRFRLIPLRDMFDPVSRDTWILRVWRDLLTELSRRNLVRIDRTLSELEDQENGAADTQ